MRRIKKTFISIVALKHNLYTNLIRTDGSSASNVDVIGTLVIAVDGCAAADIGAVHHHP